MADTNNQQSSGGSPRPGGGPRRPRDDSRTPEEKQFDERVMNIDRVARVVKGGRRFRFRALVVVGDKKGRVGIGIAKGADVTSAVTKATESAKKNFMSIKLYKGTFPHEVQAKVGGANILLIPASPGTGLIAGGVVRTVLEVAGVSNALSKSIGSSNKINTAYATLKALEQLQTADKWVTRIGQSPKKSAVQPKDATTKEVAKAPVKAKVAK